MSKLRAGNIRPVMVTGDNLLTGVHIAKEANMFFSPLSHGVWRRICVELLPEKPTYEINT